MNKINLVQIIIAFVILSIQSKAEKRRILFIGNSYVAYNDLPTTVKNVALSFGDTLEIDSNTPGGMTLNGHCSDANTLAKIQLSNWDYVVIQAQSQEPSFSPSQVATNTYPYAKKLDSLIHVSNPCAETIFYMTWGRKNGDAVNCASYPPVCTYAGMQQRLRESYLEMSMSNDATCAPAGVVWKKVRDSHPTIELYNPDESHPSVSGTYLVACTFYSTLYHKPSIGSTFISAGMNAGDALNIQTASSSIVLDSIENWQQYGSLPKASFSFSNNQNVYSFTNTSLRSTQYEWDFGDGSPISNAVNPTHTYNVNGNYIITLKAINACGIFVTYKDTLQVTFVPSTIQNVDLPSEFNINYDNELLTVKNNADGDKLRIFDLRGSLIKEFSLASSTNTFSLHLNRGIYIYSVLSKNKVMTSGKFEVIHS